MTTNNKRTKQHSKVGFHHFQLCYVIGVKTIHKPINKSEDSALIIITNPVQYILLQELLK
jgi:hypothetical protein